MANPDVTTYFDPPDPNEVPLNLTQLFQLASALVHTRILGDEFNTYIKQNTEPDADQHDKVWIQLDSQGRPLAIKTWWAGGGGHWRRVYNGMLGEIRGFSGDPGYGAYPKNFDTNGLGNIGGEYDGWGLCNGQGGRPDYSNRFLCGADMTPVPHGYTGGKWKTKIQPGDILADVGGQWTETLASDAIPWPATPAVTLDTWTASGTSPQPVGTSDLYGRHNAAAGKVDIIPATPGNPTPVGVFIGPPFYSLAWMIFVGYAP